MEEVGGAWHDESFDDDDAYDAPHPLLDAPRPLAPHSLKSPALGYIGESARRAAELAQMRRLSRSTSSPAMRQREARSPLHARHAWAVDQ